MAALKVLVATDGSDPSLRACRFARDTLKLEGASIRLLTVLSFSLDPYTLLGEEMGDTPARVERVKEAVEEATRVPAKMLEEGGAKVTTAHRFGAPADEILNELVEWEPDLVILGRRGLSLTKRWLLGSVSERVVRHAHVPVLVVS